jgi:predicted RNA-binding protein with TRAM domain
MPANALHWLFTGTVEGDDGELRLRIPDATVEDANIEPGEHVRIGLYDAPERSVAASTRGDTAATSDTNAEGDNTPAADEPTEAPPAPKPPVEAGEIRYVEVEDVGKRGDGIANVDRGYVIIVPDTEPGDRVKVEIDEVTADYAMATLLDGPA